MDDTRPDFRMQRAGFDGFREEKKLPMKSNIKALGRFITFSGEEIDCEGFRNWEEVIRAHYRRLAFFRRYYCAENLPEIVQTGGIYPVEIKQGMRLGELTNWQIKAKDLTDWADKEAKR